MGGGGNVMGSLTQAARRTCAIVIVGFPIGGGVMAGNKSPIDEARLDRIVAQARRDAEQRDKGYRERALKMYPWICGRCAREFTRANLQERKIGRASGRERVCQYVKLSGGAVSLKKKQ